MDLYIKTGVACFLAMCGVSYIGYDTDLREFEFIAWIGFGLNIFAIKVCKKRWHYCSVIFGLFLCYSVIEKASIQENTAYHIERLKNGARN